jgi:hypothetical protein
MVLKRESLMMAFNRAKLVAQLTYIGVVYDCILGNKYIRLTAQRG